MNLRFFFSLNTKLITLLIYKYKIVYPLTDSTLQVVVLAWSLFPYAYELFWEACR